MSEHLFAKGDTVRLKSGGPVMTIADLGDYHGDASAWCVWFEKTVQKTGVFGIVTLEKASPPSTTASFGRITRS